VGRKFLPGEKPKGDINFQGERRRAGDMKLGRNYSQGKKARKTRGKKNATMSKVAGRNTVDAGRKSVGTLAGHNHWTASSTRHGIKKHRRSTKKKGTRGGGKSHLTQWGKGSRQRKKISKKKTPSSIEPLDLCSGSKL